MHPDNSDSQQDVLQTAINKAINKAMGEQDAGLVVKWVACVEVFDEDGDKGLWTFTNDNAKRWDIFGLLKELEMFQQAHMIAHILEEHG